MLTRVSADVCELRQEAGVPTLPGDNALLGSPMSMSDDARGHMIAVLAGMVSETGWRS